jgi:DNA topoisomerase-6 subunit B
MASAWVPFTSESKEAIAHYPEIQKEVRLALQECGRKLSLYVRKKKRIVAEGKKRDYIQTYIPHVANALRELLKLKEKDEKKAEKLLKNILEKQRGKLHEIKVETSEFDESLALDKEEENAKEESSSKEK